jgi:hypothetical protein
MEETLDFAPNFLQSKRFCKDFAKDLVLLMGKGFGEEATLTISEGLPVETLAPAAGTPSQHGTQHALWASTTYSHAHLCVPSMFPSTPSTPGP